MITIDACAVPTIKGTKEEPTFEPVPYMSPWMFTPAYLEVDYKTLSAVFLRSPLPQPNSVEIPSPLPPRWHQLAYEWYATIKRNKTKEPLKDPLVINGITVRLKPKFDKMVRHTVRHSKRLESQEKAEDELLRKNVPSQSEKGQEAIPSNE